jgi:carbon storage regulator
MLVLTRKCKQQIQIGPDVTITILHVKGQAVRVGIEAPRNVSVLRTEVATKLGDSLDPTVMAALEKHVRETGISSPSENEDTVGRDKVSATGSLRCRAPRVDMTPSSSPFQSTGPASLLRPRRRRLAMR